MTNIRIDIAQVASEIMGRLMNIMIPLQVIIIGLLVLVGLMQALTWPYYAGVIVAIGLCVYQQKLIFHREKALCFKAFLNSNYFGMAVFIGLSLSYLI